MFRKILLGTVLIAPLMACSTPDLEPRAAESRVVAKEFMQNLKGELQTAMKAGGPVNAIGVCNETAPRIAEALSTQKGWEVGRTSLKVRNPDNAPDAWEEKVLKQFEARKVGGEDPNTLEYFEMAKTEDGKVFRYMKAIPTGEVCLACHGESIAVAVREKLQVLYPDDKATGYKVGDLRGAFTITQPM
jgi:hypothetical protein